MVSKIIRRIFDVFYASVLRFLSTRTVLSNPNPNSVDVVPVLTEDTDVYPCDQYDGRTVVVGND